MATATLEREIVRETVVKIDPYGRLYDVDVYRDAFTKQIVPAPFPTLCDVEGCDKPKRTWGFCTMHLRRYETYGDPMIRTKYDLPPRTGIMLVDPDLIKRGPNGIRICNVENCTRKHAGRGYCKMHWARVQRHGDADRPIRRKETPAEPVYVKPEDRCDVDGCHEQIHARIFCQLHYRKWLQYGDPTGNSESRVKVEELPDDLKHYMQRRRARIAASERRRLGMRE